MGKESLVGKPVDFTNIRKLCGRVMKFGENIVCTDGNEKCPHITRDPLVTPEEWVFTIAMVSAVEGCEKVVKN